MRILLLAIGRLKAGPERELAARYMERAQSLSRSVGLTGIEWRESDESRARDVAGRRAAEAKAVLAHVPPGARLVLLDERGSSISSESFASDIGRARDGGARAYYCIVIGGPDGLDGALREQAALVLSFGAMTWPHQLARILAAEQIYRAMTILAGHPYHRA